MSRIVCITIRAFPRTIVRGSIEARRAVATRIPSRRFPRTMIRGPIEATGTLAARLIHIKTLPRTIARGLI
jgi:hypothetical protein